MKKISKWLDQFKHRKSRIVINPYTDTQEDMQDKLVMACMYYLRSKCPMEVGDKMLMVQAGLCDEDVDYTAVVRLCNGATYETTNLTEEEQYSLKYQTR